MTAMEYGTQGWFPNGTHPIGAVYVDIDPALADFNIHPAKREARFRDPGAIHHAVTSGLRDFCRRLGHKIEPQAGNSMPLAMEALFPAADRGGNTPYHALNAINVNNPHNVNNINNVNKINNIDDLKIPVSRDFVAETAPIYGEPRYAGRVFGVFILLEWGEKLFIIDQHAAHERIRYNRFLSSPILQQELLIPISFNTETAEDSRFLEAKKEELAQLAIIMEKDGDGWRIDALPEDWRLSDSATVKEILALREAGENMAERWAATVCCHRAIRDGDYIDDATALALAKEALNLPDPHCPHGRPIWTELSREALYRAVRRT
jgi:DNA mismatch repair protein MutL